MYIYSTLYTCKEAVGGKGKQNSASVKVNLQFKKLVKRNHQKAF